jgi:glucosamine--fructose-6-phosphate aminotransferase (isomerizing)
LNPVIEAAKELKGQYAIAVLLLTRPNHVFLVANGSPLYVTPNGYAASDKQALAGVSFECTRIPDGGWAVLECGKSDVYAKDFYWAKECEQVPPEQESSLGDHPHYMLKEILEQPAVMRQPAEWFKERERPERVVFFGCGSSYHAAMLARSYMERLGGIPSEVEYASELSQKDFSLYSEKTLFVALTQSGETKDTLVAMEKAGQSGGDVMVVTNSEHSSADRLANLVVVLDAGVERGVAATKTFTAQVGTMFEFAAQFYHGKIPVDVMGLKIDISSEVRRHTACLVHTNLPLLMEQLLTTEMMSQIKDAAELIARYERVLYLARGLNYPAALEAALKLKEVSYIHAEAIHSAEMKHGPIALIDDHTLSVFLVTNDKDTLEKVMSNISEIRARKGQVLAITDQSTVGELQELVNWTLVMPDAQYELQPILASVVTQLLAYYAAVKLNRNVDKPRNLAKSCTVE